MLERRLDACSGEIVCVTDGSVVVPDCITVTVTVTTDSLRAVEVGVIASIDVAVAGMAPLDV